MKHLKNGHSLGGSSEPAIAVLARFGCLAQGFGNALWLVLRISLSKFQFESQQYQLSFCLHLQTSLG